MTKNNLKVVKSTKEKELENKEKNKALDAAISQITDTFGKGSVMKLGQQKAIGFPSIFFEIRPAFSLIAISISAAALGFCSR